MASFFLVKCNRTKDQLEAQMIADAVPEYGVRPILEILWQ
jgi:hypothetical protein